MSDYIRDRYSSSYFGSSYVPRSGFLCSRFDEDAYETTDHTRPSRFHNAGDYDRPRVSYDTRSRTSGRQSTVYPDDSVSSADYRPRHHRESRRDEERSDTYSDDRGRTSRRSSDYRPSNSRRRSPSITHAFAYDGTPTWTYHPPTMTERVPAMPPAPQRHSSRRQSEAYTNDSRSTYLDEPSRRSSRTQSGHHTSTSERRSRRSDAPLAGSTPSRSSSRVPSRLNSLNHHATRPTSAMSWSTPTSRQVRVGQCLVRVQVATELPARLPEPAGRR